MKPQAYVNSPAARPRGDGFLQVPIGNVVVVHDELEVRSAACA
jgi:hypothetical protein